MLLDIQSSPGVHKRDRVSVWLATGVGLGLAVPAPGTVAGGFWGLPAAYAIAQLPQLGAQLAAIVVLGALATYVCSSAAAQLASDDPQGIILDEVVGLSIAFVGLFQPTLGVMFVGFFLFRLFDIWKPFPCKQAERLPGGWGVVADDVVAGVMSCAVLHFLLWLDDAWALHWLTTGY